MQRDSPAVGKTLSGEKAALNTVVYQMSVMDGTCYAYGRLVLSYVIDQVLFENGIPTRSLETHARTKGVVKGKFVVLDYPPKPSEGD